MTIFTYTLPAHRALPKCKHDHIDQPASGCIVRIPNHVYSESVSNLARCIGLCLSNDRPYLYYVTLRLCEFVTYRIMQNLRLV